VVGAGPKTPSYTPEWDILKVMRKIIKLKEEEI